MEVDKFPPSCVSWFEDVVVRKIGNGESMSFWLVAEDHFVQQMVGLKEKSGKRTSIWFGWQLYGLYRLLGIRLWFEGKHVSIHDVIYKIKYLSWSWFSMVGKEET
ncbi:unnamed protein product [Trifolium pratense]|uniref:Uncharacterized protein n=1 Tax=Trifolium pratense TaxID=57577 RepID=A0ACB0K7Q7_TRIPR|nr:unnamed protein product [Trifolium pratense]